ncbi:MAG: hypothetical protein GY696_16250 [Gammaproteobacteria bacterium]|nr:hypothetical protein [Gammaproteobacteria bacterium]
MCPNNAQPYSSLGQAITCNINERNSCPYQYQCQRKTPSSIAYCCPGGGTSTSTTVCPFNLRPLVYGIGSQAQTCNQFSFCPFGYQCLGSTMNNGLFYCCTSDSGI